MSTRLSASRHRSLPGSGFAGDDDAAAVLVAKDRRAGIAGAGTQPGAIAFGLRIEQADLQAAGLTGGDQRGSTNRAAGAAIAAHGDAVARDHKRIADGDRFLLGAERHG